MGKLRVGFLVDNENINFYIGDLINFVDKDKAFDKPIIITGYKKKTSNYLKNKLKILFERTKFHPIQKIKSGFFFFTNL